MSDFIKTLILPNSNKIYTLKEAEYKYYKTTMRFLFNHYIVMNNMKQKIVHSKIKRII